MGGKFFYFILLAVIAGLVSGLLIYYPQVSEQPGSSQGTKGAWTNATTANATAPNAIAANIYKYVASKPAGWFRTGQAADIVLYATSFDESGGPLVLNHPGKAATDGKRLIVSDTWNNRVLIWNDMPVRSGQQPDLVLGQPGFSSNVGKLGRDGMNWPMGVATDGKKLLVADAYNDRVLIWNEFPTKNNQPADLVLGAPDFDTWPNYLELSEGRNPTTRIYWPWDVWTDGKKVIVTSTVDGSVLIWNSFPAGNNQPADMVLGAENFSARFGQVENPLADLQTPRAIAFDGRHLVIGDYNGEGAFVWDGFPAKNGQLADFILRIKRVENEGYNSIMGVAVTDGRLFAASAHQIFVWNDFPGNGSQKEDFRIGKLEPNLTSSGMSGPLGVATDGKRLIVADTNNNRVLIFNGIPEKAGASADIVLGQPGFGANVFKSRGSCGNPSPYSDGKQLFVACDFDRRIHVYDRLPDESKANADAVITNWGDAGLGGAHQITSDGKRLIVANREAGRVLIWNEIPKKDNQLPDVVLGISAELGWWRNGKGSVGLSGPMGVTTDGKRLFVSDSGNNRILIWNEIPAISQTPADLAIGQRDFDSTSPGSGLNGLDSPTQISTDGRRLVAADMRNNRILVWRSVPTASGQPADFQIKTVNHSAGPNLISTPQYGRITGTQGVFIYNNSLFVSDGGNNRVLVWTKFPESENDEPDIVLGQKDFVSNYPSNSRNNLFLPAQISFDGSFLWVGETKWSNRLLRFSVQPT